MQKPLGKFKLFFWALGLSFLILGLRLEAISKTQSTDLAHELRLGFGPYPPMHYPVRIGLAPPPYRSYVYLWEPGALFVDEKPVFALIARRPYIIDHGRISDLAGGKGYQLPRDRRAYIAACSPRYGYRVWTNNRWYAGVLELISFGNKVNVVNLLDMEDYLRGVVPAEMPASWHLEALKAQAVAARSYAWAHTGANSKWYRTQGYDLVPDVRDQVYKGLAIAANSSDWAVKLTQGIVLQEPGRVKPGFYRAWVGNFFENLNIRQSVVSNAVLEKITGVPKIIGVTVKQWDQNSNARSIQVIGAKKSREVYGVALAKMLHFASAGILDVKESGKDWLFIYRGPGNGARGLSQHGANMLAANGWQFGQILQQYYQDPDGKLRFERKY